MEATTRRAKVEPETYWAGWVQVIRPDGTRGCGVSIQGRTLADCIADGFRNGTYYLAMGYEVELQGMVRFCEGCRGSGWSMRTPRKSVKCKACRGVGELGTFDDIPLTPCEGVEVKQRTDGPAIA
jgi:DnaJ-class molecular chaperone